MKRYMMIAAALFLVAACAEKPQTNTGKDDEKVDTEFVFAKGADISWVTEMEANGVKFYNAAGQEKECTALMKELGMNAIRLRVWVNPADGWSGCDDVVAKALRAKQNGMRLMIDFHYSDNWADPSKQNVPAAWASYDPAQMATAVYEHTEQVLTALKNAGVSVEWIQTGNETTDGMLWPSGKCSTNPKNFANYVKAGYEAAKKVYPDSKVFVHVDRGQELGHIEWLVSQLLTYGGKFDMIGVSLYPCYWNDSKGDFDTEWQSAVKSCLDNLKTLNAKYSCNTIICEVGMPYKYPAVAKEMLSTLISGAKNAGTIEGVFYWEPESSPETNGGYSLGAFQNGRPTEALDAFKY
ncbi:MAG: arabinogalactan endo-beta-1,4-galactanase [Candidatus Cryptobacteroides sp.]